MGNGAGNLALMELMTRQTMIPINPMMPMNSGMAPTDPSFGTSPTQTDMTSPGSGMDPLSNTGAPSTDSTETTTTTGTDESIGIDPVDSTGGLSGDGLDPALTEATGTSPGEFDTTDTSVLDPTGTTNTASTEEMGTDLDPGDPSATSALDPTGATTTTAGAAKPTSGTGIAGTVKSAI
ncbi:hypothetical protein Poli38472_014736 [Pythium oligandrum]|uniref:Uncharacterized protein n=1 Tax=Pythium oligandrum TaxID=41045 RepID=A0A8K1C1Z8_PYTOL|nr:hypothetical protein Poli38472_014736 [Pythium oligandrum]|eukprot:TMW54965.1 hypothetical protein Poli38472_014736 [Pythium oligandrum]